LEHEESLDERSLCCQSEYLVDDPVLCEDIPLGKPIELAFAEHGHGFIAVDSPLRCVECPKPQPRVHPVLHTPMILFHHIIIQILALSEPTDLWECSLLPKDLESGWRRGVLIHGDHTGGTRL
jgi:hypothetical protein